MSIFGGDTSATLGGYYFQGREPCEPRGEKAGEYSRAAFSAHPD